MHHLTPDQVHRISADYYMVDGYHQRIPASSALPSQDGDYWIFYRDDGGGSQSGVYCFFVPMDFGPDPRPGGSGAQFDPAKSVFPAGPRPVAEIVCSVVLRCSGFLK